MLYLVFRKKIGGKGTGSSLRRDGLTAPIAVSPTALCHATTGKSWSNQHESFFSTRMTKDKVQESDVGREIEAFPLKNAEVGDDRLISKPELLNGDGGDQSGGYTRSRTSRAR